MNTLIIVKIKNTTYDEWRKKFDADAEVQSQMMRNTIVGKVDDNTVMMLNINVNFANFRQVLHYIFPKQQLAF